ncbi:DivIVA domain-containing protein [Flaviflexus massiliensis]|uniref:DivIVA domain-containing protein n=1 Tax=Flaviflexus massiliensis TaxID=1522309 RepID=UPI0006D58C30|nr:DivIVA domain-containing protein [Flaviflexus massiliensis]
MATFRTTGNWKQGYDIDAVDTFLMEARELYQQEELPEELDIERIRTVAFPMSRNGYRVDDVDEALNRLEQACWQRKRAQVVSTSGTKAWLSEAYDSASSLYPRLNRPRGERFDAPKKGRGYDRAEVDDLLDSLAKYFDGRVEMTAEDISSAAFKTRLKSRSYSIPVVDAYLDRASAVLRAVE